MPKWGPNRDEDFIISVLTTSFDDNKKSAYLQLASKVYIDLFYTKGAEAFMEVRIRYSLDGTNWVGLTQIAGPQTELLDLVPRMVSTGNRTLELGITDQTKFLEVAVKGSGAPSGTVRIRYRTNNPISNPVW